MRTKSDHKPIMLIGPIGRPRHPSHWALVNVRPPGCVGRIARCALALALLLPQCLMGGPLLQRFFPLCNGDSKTLNAPSPVGSFPITVVATTYNGQSAFEMRITSGSGDTFSDQRRYFRISGDDLLYLGMTFSSSVGSLSATFTPPVRMLSESVVAGGGPISGTTAVSVQSSLGSASGQVDYSYTTSLSGPLSVPACDYDDSRSVNGSFTITIPDPEDPHRRLCRPFLISSILPPTWESRKSGFMR